MTDPGRISDELRDTMKALIGDNYDHIEHTLRMKISEAVLDKDRSMPISWEGLIEEIHNLKKKAKNKQPSRPNAFLITRELMKSLQRAKILSDEELSVFGWSDIVDGIERLLRLYNRLKAELEASETALQELCDFLGVAPEAISWPGLVNRIKQLTSTPIQLVDDFDSVRLTYPNGTVQEFTKGNPSKEDCYPSDTPAQGDIKYEPPATPPPPVIWATAESLDALREELERKTQHAAWHTWHNAEHIAPEAHPGKGAFIPGLGRIRPCDGCGCLIVRDATRCKNCTAYEDLRKI